MNVNGNHKRFDVNDMSVLWQSSSSISNFSSNIKKIQ